MSEKQVIFETERLIVRLYTTEDEEIFFNLNGDEEVVRYIRPVKNREECNQFLKDIIHDAEKNPLIGRWAVDEKRTGNNVGMFAIIPVDETNKLQLGYALLKEYWGRGFATELTSHGIDYFFDNLNRRELYALTEEPNIASQKVLEKCGFRLSVSYEKGQKKVLEYMALPQ
ncbi:MAG: GNAT family N-acetyltransferase [Chitinophagaceae bacterium]